MESEPTKSQGWWTRTRGATVAVATFIGATSTVIGLFFAFWQDQEQRWSFVKARLPQTVVDWLDIDTTTTADNDLDYVLRSNTTNSLKAETIFGKPRLQGESEDKSEEYKLYDNEFGILYTSSFSGKNQGFVYMPKNITSIMRKELLKYNIHPSANFTTFKKAFQNSKFIASTFDDIEYIAISPVYVYDGETTLVYYSNKKFLGNCFFGELRQSLYYGEVKHTDCQNINLELKFAMMSRVFNFNPKDDLMYSIYLKGIDKEFIPISIVAFYTYMSNWTATPFSREVEKRTK